MSNLDLSLNFSILSDNPMCGGEDGVEWKQNEKKRAHSRIFTMGLILC